MRTKTLLLTAALGLASAATSMAQAVYSLNVVGYINLTLKPGFNLIANQLKASPDNKLDTILPAAPLLSAVYKFSTVSQNFTIELSDGSNWFTPEGNPGTITLAPGEGAFYFNPDPANQVKTLVGEVQQGSSTVTMKPGFNLVSTVVPQELSLTLANGFPQELLAQYMPYNTTTQAFDLIINDGTGWFTPEGAPVDAKPKVGEGWFYFNPTAGNQLWTRTFNAN
jgi:hypothetical protein